MNKILSILLILLLIATPCYAVYFDGTDGTISACTNDEHFDNNQFNSLAVAFRTTSSGYLFSTRVVPAAAPYIALLVSGGKAICRYRDFATSTAIDLTTTTSVDDGEWHIVSIRLDDSSNDGISCYLDGVKEDEDTGNRIDTLDWDGSQDAYIGSRNNADTYFTGDIAWVWTHAHDSTEERHKQITGSKVMRFPLNAPFINTGDQSLYFDLSGGGDDIDGVNFVADTGGSSTCTGVGIDTTGGSKAGGVLPYP